ncbi:DNA dC-_dU-editing enzyme APOBEC-3G-like isoform X4 [Suricata suricatta]|uniref:DNA dC->dU-editing enzyme APOBEC-3G-like isoform X4 n=1 Tax=Suricata suricatta TaxID=37032 RepID=UPI001155FD2D|nr:DNA dC->dU-editing enzyme APOBEC-3G-like isoform X4 [Suricata suricatta]
MFPRGNRGTQSYPLGPHGCHTLAWSQPAQHAEVRLLKRIQSWELGSELPYEVTCFQSWSPCCNCAKQLARFLEENKHVTLSIFASRLHTMEDYEEGLRILRSAGAHIAIMTSQDFEHCWDTSVDNHGNPFQPWNTLVSQSQKLSEKLKVILKVMDLPPLCLPCPPPASPGSSLSLSPSSSSGIPAPSQNASVLGPGLLPLFPTSLGPPPSLLCGCQTTSVCPLSLCLTARPIHLLLLVLGQRAEDGLQCR